MTELELLKFINDFNIEYHWSHNEDGYEDVLICPYNFQLTSFATLFKDYLKRDNRIEMILCDGYFCVWMNDICDNLGIEIENVFTKEDSNE